ncbi:MAG TPA: hypothetical protein VGS08_03395 [Candidatus Saccharimonadales bacterium]|nr:hypothetical protein [Candidatus Saccharimonadales bacterium]
MIILAHVAIALSSLIYTSYAFLSPSETKVKISYGFLAGTIASGTYLIVTLPGHIISACITGLSYVLFMLVAIAGARARLARVRIRANRQH